MFPGELNSITTMPLTIQLYLQEKTGSSPKWVTRFQLPEVLLKQRYYNVAYSNDESPNPLFI